MRTLSILLPTYNCRCVELVKALHSQCEAIDGLCYEIIVADDGSPEKRYIEENKAIEALAHVRYIIRKKNVGRSGIRNVLIGEARYDWLLFIDGDLTLANPILIRQYLSAEGDVVVGGITVASDLNQSLSLRYKYEKAAESQHDAAHRKTHPYSEFRTTNFMVSRRVMETCPFDESVTHYGYEDVLLGKAFKEHGPTITHIDNPATLANFESNADYLAKIETSCQTLLQLRDRLTGYSTLLAWADRLRRCGLLPVADRFFRVAQKAMKDNLLGNNPSVFVFNIYKLAYYVHLERMAEHKV